jgi:uncharacterized LabA/DUF88 family protein
MISRAVAAALFVDLDNVVQYGLADHIDHWTAWLEDGQFDPTGRRRRLRHKRVYWNSQFEGLRDEFTAHGFQPIICPSRLRRHKSAVDMNLALDAFDLAMRDARIDEFILLTTDSDFIPLIERLTQCSKSSVALADPEKPFLYSTYADHANIVIPTFSIEGAIDYQRPPGRRARRWLRKKQPAAPADTSAPRRVCELEAAAQIVADLAKQKGGAELSRRAIMRALRLRFVGFTQSNWFGCGSYRDFIIKAAELHPELKVGPAYNGGLCVRYRTGSAPKT